MKETKEIMEGMLKAQPEEEKIGKYKRVEAGSKKSFGNFEAELVNKVSSYCTLIDMDRIKYISSLIEKDLENKVLANDFIELDSYFYFNWQELLENKRVKASTVEPINNFRDSYVMKKIPNNMDTFSTEHNSFCYENNPTRHRGFYFLPKLKKADNGLDIETYILFFDYDIMKDFLEISLIDNKEDLLILRMDSTGKTFFSNILDYVKNIVTKDNEINLPTFFSEIPIIENYHNKKMFEAAEKSGMLEKVKSFEKGSSIPEDVYSYIVLHDKEDPYMEEMKEHLNNLEAIHYNVKIYGMESEENNVFYLEE